MAGTFGYELDLNLITDEEKEIVKKQIADCRKYWNLTHEGRYYRLTNPMTNAEMAAWEFVAEDQSEALVSVVLLGTHFNAPINYVHIKGLKPEAIYREEASGQEYSGSVLMHAGLPLPMETGEYQSWQLYFKEV
jgi:alpha-galactosidase